MASVNPGTLKKGLASSVILAVLALQGAAAFGAISSLTWPLTDYPMYRSAHYEGDAIEQYTVVGVLDDAREVVLAPEDFGLNGWKFERLFIRELWDANRGAQESLEMYRQLYQRRHGQRLAGLRLENRPFILRREGIRRAASETVKVVTFEAPRAPKP